MVSMQDYKLKSANRDPVISKVNGTQSFIDHLLCCIKYHLIYFSLINSARKKDRLNGMSAVQPCNVSLLLSMLCDDDYQSICLSCADHDHFWKNILLVICKMIDLWQFFSWYSHILSRNALEKLLATIWLQWNMFIDTINITYKDVWEQQWINRRLCCLFG